MPYPKDKINSNDKNTVSEWEPGGRNLLFFYFLPLVLGEEPRASLMLSMRSTMETHANPR